MVDHKSSYVRSHKHMTDLVEIIQDVKPTILIGEYNLLLLRPGLKCSGARYFFMMFKMSATLEPGRPDKTYTVVY